MRMKAAEKMISRIIVVILRNLVIFCDFLKDFLKVKKVKMMVKKSEIAIKMARYLSGNTESQTKIPQVLAAQMM